MKRKIISILLALVLVVTLGLVTAVPVAAEPDGTVEIAQIINPANAGQNADDIALFNWLADYDTDVTQILVGDMAAKSTEYWEQFDLIILPKAIVSTFSIANLVSSEVPIIAMSLGHADGLELGTGEQTFAKSTRNFNVIDDTHPITSGLSPGAWTWSGTGFMWTHGTDNAGYEGTAKVLVDSTEFGGDILIVHQTKQYAFFGWYRASQWPDEGWDLMEKTIGWAIGRPLPTFSLEFTVEITDTDTIYKPGDTITIVVDAGTAGYTVTGSFSDLMPVKMAGIAYLADNWWGEGRVESEGARYWLDTYLGSLGYTVEGIPQGTAGSYTSAQWEAYDVVFIFSNNFASPDLTTLIDSNVPKIMTGFDAEYVPEAGLGDGTYVKDDMQSFYIIDNTHPITQGLSLGEWTFASSMWTTRIGTEGFGLSVLIDDNDSPAKAYLATSEDPNRVWFGYYQGTQAGAEARDIFSNSIAWALGKDSLPNLKLDATDNDNGTYSISYPIGYIPLLGPHTILITVEDQVGHTATDDSLSVTIPVPTEVWVDDGYTAGPDVGTSESCGGHIWGYDAFSTIQGGINTVDEHGAVNVAAGIYYEHVVIDKQLTLLGANHDVNPVTHLGERGPESIIDGSQLTPAAGGLVQITGAANGIVFKGFTVRESLYSTGGIYAQSDNSVYENNIISDNGNTAFYTVTDGNVLRNNVISNNRHSGEIGQICLQMGADDNIIENNAISGDGRIQIKLWNAYNGNIIQNNVITGIGLEEFQEHYTGPDARTCGIGLSDVGNDTIIRGNTIAPEEGSLGFDYGIFTAGTRFGISNTLVEDNIVHHCGIGIDPFQSVNALLRGNDVRWCEKGIRVLSAQDTTIEDNNILYNDVGISFYEAYPSTNTHINHNNIVGNTVGVQNESLTTVVDATSNWWGSASGAGEDGANDVSDMVAYSPWLEDTKDTSPMTFIVDDVGPEPDAGYIQTAINAADSGDTIIVAAGTYNENVVVDETLTLQGEDRETTIIEGGGDTSLPTLTISASGVTVSEFTVHSESTKEPVWTIRVEGDSTQLTDLHVIKDPDKWISGAAVFVAPGVDSFAFTDSTVDSVWNGIYAPRNPGSSNIVVRNVGFTYPGEYGILLMMTSGATIKGNTFTCTGHNMADKDSNGIIITKGSNAIEVSGNQFIGSQPVLARNHIGILLQAYAEGTMGDVTILDNGISGFNTGILVQDVATSGISIHYNNIHDNTDGGLVNEATETVDATHNWWGDRTGPWHATLNAGAQGNAVSDNVTFSPRLYHPFPQPSIVTSAALSVTTGQATLNGNSNSLGSVSLVNVSFEWGTTTAYGRETTTAEITSIGSFSFSLSGLSPDTTYHFRAKAAGDGTSYGADRTFTTTAPPTVTIGAVTTPTNVATQTLTGTMEKGATVALTADTAATFGEVTYTTKKKWSCEVTFVEGSNEITATATDAVGSEGTATTTIVLDTAVSVTIDAVTTLTNVATQTLSGTMEEGATVALTADTAATFGEVSYTAITWSCEVTLVEGSNELTATATDAVGNEDTATTTIVLDTAALSVTIDAVTTPTGVATQTLGGTMEEGTTVTLTADTAATFGEVTYITAITWSCKVTLVEGSNEITATATDAVGNEGTATTTIVLDIDKIPPAQITDLAANPGSPATTRVILGWTAPGDDEDVGTATSYEIRRSTTSEITDANWALATTIYNNIVPQAAGGLESFVARLTPNRTYYFAIQAKDEADNISLSNSASINTAANLPTITGISPTSGENSQAWTLTIDGDNFVDGTNVVRFVSGDNTFDLTNVTYVSLTQLTADVAKGAPTGSYRARVINDNGTSELTVTVTYEVTEAPVALPVVTNLIPQMAASDSAVTGVQIFGEYLADATVVSFDGTAASNVMVISDTKITVDVPGLSAGEYDVKVTTPDGTNEISGVKFVVSDPVAITEDTTEDTTTSEVVKLDTNVIPVQLTLTTDTSETATQATDTDAEIEVTIPPQTTVTCEGKPYTGNINPPRVVKPDKSVLPDLSDDAVVIEMGNPEKTLKFDQDFVAIITITAPVQPVIWYFNKDTGAYDLAGKTGPKDGVNYVPGGTNLGQENSTYTIGLLLDHMSPYVAGVKPNITSALATVTAGSAFTITGDNFHPTAAEVYFGDTAGTIVSRTLTTQIVVKFPTAGSYTLKVENPDQLSDTTSITLATPAPVVPPPTPPAPPPGTTDVRGMVTTAGVFLEPVTAISEDELCTLTISEGTLGLTEELEPLKEITMEIMDEPPPPPEDAHVVGLAYDLGPDGATFDPPLTLTFSYDPDALPEGVAEEDLVLAYYDEEAGEWVELDYVVDTENNIITASVPRFTTFAVIGVVPVVAPPTPTPPAPARFTISSLGVSPSELAPGEEVNISVLVANTGGKSGSYTVVLNIDGVKEAEERVRIAAGRSQSVSFTVSKEDAGSYSVVVDGLSDSFTVVAVVVPPTPPAFSVSYLSVSPQLEVEPGELVTITVLVANTGGESGSYTVVLKIDGVKEAEETVTVAAGEGQDVSFSVTREEANSYAVTVDGLSGSFTVVAPEEEEEEEEEVPTEPGINWPLIGGIIGGVIVVGLGVFFWIRRRAY